MLEEMKVCKFLSVCWWLELECRHCLHHCLMKVTLVWELMVLEGALGWVSNQ